MTAATANSAPRLRLWLLSWIALSVALLVAGRSLFVTPLYEEGDGAANALSIHRAKHFAELHGNYSRFQFHHPGPAFFSVYALGETVFYDWLKLVPARNNAHLLASALLQAAFLAAIATMVAGASARPLSAAALVVALGLIHFAFAPPVFLDIWPPRVLMLPFACFLVAATGVALGRWSDLPWLVLAGGFLVHGHVAQPLLVAPLGGAALAIGWRRHRRPTSALLFLAGALASLFALPLLLDLLHGRESNAYRVLLHLRFDSGGRPGWPAALLSTLSYLTYCADQETWWGPQATGTVASFLHLHAGGLVIAALLAVLVVVRLVLPTRTPTALFGRALAIICLAALLLAILWARRQDDGITGFNSYFVFGLAFAAILAALLPLAEALGPRLPVLAASALGGALLFATPHYTVDPRATNPLGQEIASRLPALLAADHAPGAPKILVFDHATWIEAITLAAALDRASIPFRVSPAWGVMFGDDHVLRATDVFATDGRGSWWRLTPASAATPSATPLTREVAVDFPAAPELGALPATLTFGAAGDAAPYEFFGYAPPDDIYTWTDAAVAVLRFRAAPTERALTLALDASALTLAPAATQRVRVFVNHHEIGAFSVGYQRATAHLAIPTDVWNSRSAPAIVELTLLLPDRIVPAHHEWTRETRELGLRLHRLTIATAAAEAR